MNADLQALFDPSDPGARQRGAVGLLASADGPLKLERALLDVFALGDNALLES